MVVQEHLYRLLKSNVLHEYALNDGLIERALCLQICELCPLLLEIRGQILVDHEDFGLGRANLVKHLILVKLDSADGSLSLHDLALISCIHSFHRLVHFLRLFLKPMFNLIVACFSHSLNFILDVCLNLRHSLRIVTVIYSRHLLGRAASGPHQGRIGVS